ncbi:MAG: DUF2510 domain-containing protein [Acidimicrobiales bacterium]
MTEGLTALLGLGFLAGAIVSIVAVADAASRPRWAYEQAGFEKVLWVTLAAMGIVLSWVGVAGAVWYLASVRVRVTAAQSAPRLHVPAPPPPARVAPTARPAEWLPDPSGRHEVRWWDGARWSEHVADRGVTAWDRV